MKGLVFTEFLALVEDKFGYEMVDKIIMESNVPNDGAYSSVGTYDHTELVSMLVALHKNTKIPIPDLIEVYGIYLFDVLRKKYSQFIDRVDNLFDFLSSINDHIHVEVLKLYPDAELPTFVIENRSDNEMSMIYNSERKLSALALGLMRRSAEYYNEKVEIKLENLDEAGVQVRFLIRRI